MNFNEYQELSKRTMPAPLIETSTQVVYSTDAKANYALGLVCEAGEVGDTIKKELFHGHLVDREKKIDELGDILHYYQGVLQMYEITLEEVMEYNIHKLSKRYPGGFSQEASINRED